MTSPVTSASASPASATGPFQRLERWARWLVTPKGFHLFVLGYLLIVFLERAYLFPATGGDDAEQLLFSQVFAWGYDIRNPPLYTWLVALSQSVMGVTIASVEIVKFVLFGLTYILMYRCARRVLGPGLLAGLAALSPIGIYYLTWDAVLGYSHSILMMTLCVATFAALLRLDERGDTGSYVLLGLVTGLGLMSKYGFLFFMLALIAGALTEDGLRKRLRDWRSLLALGLAAAVVLPHAAWALNWIADNPAGLAERVDEKFAVGAGASLLATRVEGLLGFLNAAIGFLLPLILLLGGLFWPGLKPMTMPDAPSARYRRVLSAYLLFLLVVVAIAIIASGITRFRTHYMFVLILLPLWYFARVQASWYWHRAPALFAGALTLMAGLVVVALPVKDWLDPKVCDKCYFHLDYADMTRQLRAAGFDGGTFFGADYPHDLAGNLRVHFPHTRVMSNKHRYFVPPAPTEGPRDCAVMWRPGFKNDMVDYAETVLGSPDQTAFPVRDLAVPIVGNPAHTVAFQAVVFPYEAGGCPNTPDAGDSGPQ